VIGLAEGGENAMMGDMMDRCMDGMGSVLGGGMMGSSVMLFVLLLALVVWVIGLAAVGALIFWGVRKLSRTSSANS
jgi:hypothetical protein